MQSLIPCMLASAIAVPGLPAATGPPASYRLQDVTIIWGQYGGLVGNSRTLTIHGTGEAAYDAVEATGKQSSQFSVSREAIQQIVEEMYRIYFFDFRSHYAREEDVHISADGVVRTDNGSIEDASWTSVTFKVGQYEKTVSFFRPGPHGLKELSEQISALRTAPNQPRTQ